jgi:GcrA cell cycle regulator
MGQSTWTRADKATLERLWMDEGLSAGVIAKMLGTTRNAVIGKINRMGLTRSPSIARMNYTYAMAIRSARGRARKVVKPHLGAHPGHKHNASDQKVRHILAVASAKLAFAGKAGPTPPHAKPLLDLARHECKWPVNDARSSDGHVFCAAHTEIGCNYCPEHQARAWQPSREKRVDGTRFAF